MSSLSPLNTTSHAFTCLSFPNANVTSTFRHPLFNEGFHANLPYHFNTIRQDYFILVTIGSCGWKWQVLTLDLQEWQLCWVFIKRQLISCHLSTSKLHWLIIFFLKPNLITKAQAAWSHISTEKKKDCVKLKKFSNILVWKGHWRGSVSKEKMYFFFHFSSKLSLCVRRGRTFSFTLLFFGTKIEV